MTRLGAKIAVEPLDEERYAHIEQQVMAAYQSAAVDASPPQRSWFGGWRRLAPVMAVACALVLVYLGTRWWTSDNRTVVAHGQSARIVTDESGQTHYQLGDADIAVGAGTTIDVRLEPVDTGAQHAVHVDLLAGTIDCQVDPIPGRAPFIVHAGDIDVTVVGTAFRVERDDTVRVSVTRGKVRVDGPDGPHLLGPGESWSGPVILAENRASAPRVASPVASDDQDPPDAPDDTAAPGRTIGHDPTGADGALDQRRASAVVPELSGRGKSSDRKPPVDRKDESADGASRPRDRGKRTRAGDTRKRGDGAKQPPRSPRERELASARPARGRPPAGNEALASALELEKDDPRAALERYSKLALGRGAEAEFALYSKAFLEHLRLGRSSSALSTLSHYQRRFARGANGESAQWLRIHILCQKKDLKKCRAAAHSYLSQYKQGRHRQLAGRIIHWGM